jgi:beta-glucosidase-like glycosyl hydrolase
MVKTSTMKSFYCYFFLLLFCSFPLRAQTVSKQKWVENTYAAMSPEERLGQLFVIMVQSRAEENVLTAFENEVSRYQPGGVLFSLGTPYKQAELTNHYQSISKVPLMISMDAEWGIAMRLDSVPSYPWNMTLGAIQDLELIRTLGQHMGMQAKRLGVHMNFAPVADVNINPNNPIIGNRSFGSDVRKVSARALALSQGMNREGVLTCAKHFPGHGDTEVDSHKALPVLPFTKARLDSIELYPYKTPLLQGVQGVMVAHLDVPVLTGVPGLPVSLSKKATTDLLQKTLGFKGLVFTDALNMKGASDFSSDGDVALMAFLAGNDVLVIPNNLGFSIQHMKVALDNGSLTQERLAHSVKKILAAKYNLGLHHYSPIVLKGLTNDLNLPMYQKAIEKAYDHAATFVQQGSRPAIVIAKNAKVAYVKMGDASGMSFERDLLKRGAVAFTTEQLATNVKQLSGFEYVVVGHHRPMDTAYKAHKMTEEEIRLLKKINDLDNSMVLAVFTKPYALLDIPFVSDIPALFFGYQNAPEMGTYAVRVLYGEVTALGKLPVALAGVKK